MNPIAPARPGARRLPPLLLLALLLLAAPAADAHALLSSATPAPNTRVDTAPTELRITFSEPLEDSYTGIDVEGPDGARFDRETRIDPDDRRKVTVPLEPMPDGVYTVRWHSLSSADGHTRSGVYFLAVNTSLGPAADPGTHPGASMPWWEPVARAVGFAGANLALGVPLFAALVLGRTDRNAALLAGAGALAAGLAAVALLAGMAHRTGLDVSTVAQTRNGGLVLWRALLFLVAGAAALAGWRDPSRSRGWLAVTLVAAAVAMWTTSLAGHAAASTMPLAVEVDWLHQLLVATWVGGVEALLLPPRADAAVVGRFSVVAMVAVVGIVVTGVLASLDRVPSLAALTGSAYGRVLLAKVAAMVPLVALGAYHRYILAPRLAAGADPRRTLRLEVGLMTVVLVLAGALTSLSPPAAGTDDPDAADGPDAVLTSSDFRAEVRVEPKPVTVGFQDLFVELEPRSDRVNLSRVEVYGTFLSPSDPYGESTPLRAHRLTETRYHFGGALFTESGNWTVRLTVQGSGFLQGNVVVPVASAS